MAWEVVKIENNKKCKSVPAASVGFGRISLNIAACELIEDYDTYKFAELLTDSLQPSVFGIKLLKENTENSITIKRKQTKDKKIVGGIDISSKHHTEKLFGKIGTQNKVTHYAVTKPSEYDNFLIISLKQ